MKLIPVILLCTLMSIPLDSQNGCVSQLVIGKIMGLQKAIKTYRTLKQMNFGIIPTAYADNQKISSIG